MPTDRFWFHISNISQEFLGTEEEDKALEHMVNELSNEPFAEIEKFQEDLTKCLYDLDGKAFFEECINSQTADTFLYARCFVVAKGKNYYLNVLSNPRLMPKSNESFESLLFAAASAHSKKVGTTLLDWDYKTELSYETGSNTELWK